MATAYTPGLKVSEYEVLQKRRILPVKGEVVAESGSNVHPDTVVARTFLPGRVGIINVANKLGVDQGDVPGSMTKKEGERVEEGEMIAESKGLFGKFFKAQAHATMGGTVEGVSAVTGQVILRGDPIPIEVKAYVEGDVVEVVPDEGVVVETKGAFIQGIFGIGGEVFGEVVMATASPTEVLEPDLIKNEHKDKILCGGSLVTNAALRKAIEVGAAGVVVGGFDDQDLREFLGFDLGVAITGHENLGITLIVTEGFGQIDMAPRTYKLLHKYEGHRASINGATQIRAGVIRPEVIIPLEEGDVVPTDIKHTGGQLDPGTAVRVIRAPHFGLLAKVKSLPSEKHVLGSGSKARVVEVETAEGESLILPRANVEIIEE